MEITAFSRDTTDNFGKLNATTKFGVKLPSSITYHIMNAFPTSVVSAPLAYGRAELVKTTITFNYEQFFTQRTSRRGGSFAESDMEGQERTPDFVEDTDNTSTDNLETTIKKTNKKKEKNEKPFSRERILGTQNPFVREGF